MSMETQVAEILISVCLGFLGAPTRMMAQYLNGKPLPTDGFKVFAEGFISAMSGLVYYLITGWGVNDLRVIALGSLMAGYVGVDFITNSLGQKRG